MGEDFHFVFGGPVLDSSNEKRPGWRVSLISEKLLLKGKALDLKKPCKVPLIKMQK
ncbi:hypothetical protein [Methanosarcina sp. WWM596]|uniref:hypothetical protein n=1 Tax=Methanosarcina sp. WWM596 TaxID=1434103 RepID=UPI000A815C83|nr:hypothetical protein [Methanosarcina sp. WWM596]